MNVTRPLREQAHRTPDAIAYVGSRRKVLTYAALDRAVDALAARFTACGVVRGEVAMVALADPFRLLVGTLALARLGVPQGPMPFPVAHAQLAVVDDPAAADGIRRCIVLDDTWMEAPTDVPPVPMDDDGASVVLYCPSSGTSGARKFVPMSHALAHTRADRRAAPVRGVPLRDGPALRLACFIGLHSSFGLCSVLHALARGGTLVEPDRDAGRMAGWFLHSRASHLITSPIGLARLLDTLPPGRVPNGLDVIEVGGAVLPPRVLAAARERLCGVVMVGYGLTECGRVAGGEAADLAGQPTAVGYPYPDVEIRIVDHDAATVPAGAEGVVHVRSPRVASAYLDDAAATVATFRDGWVVTGDRGLLAPDGMLHIVGRADDVINCGGVKIDPLAVENALVALGGLVAAAAFGAVDDAGDMRLCAAVVPELPIAAEPFHALVRERLGPLAPVLILHLAELPRNANGKVLRQELARMAQAARPS